MGNRKSTGDVERVTVVGLGRFGSSVARTLHELGYEVTAIDVDEKRVAEAADYVTLAAQGDGADEEVLRSLRVDESDVGIVAQGENIEASLLCALALKRLAVPWVVAKATTAAHGELLDRIGADRIIFPERDAGIRLAHALAVRHISDYIPLGPATGIAKLTPPAHFVGRTLAELCANEADRLSVLLIKRGSTLLTVPAFEERVQTGDELLLAGPDAAIDAFADAGEPT